MLFPIGDDNSGRTTTPYVVYTIIALNIFVFVFLQRLGFPSGDAFTYGYAVVPYEITTGEDLKEPIVVHSGRGDVRVGAPRESAIPEYPGPSPIWLTILTAMFMHGGFMHIIGNMLYLWIFGDNIEDNFGHGRFIIFYLICGVVATFAQIYADPSSPIPNLGASGAIAGVLGAYLIMFPTNRVKVLTTFFFITITEIPAVIVLGFWIVIQIFSQYTANIKHAQGGVAYMAHIGGFVAGVLLTFLFRKKRPPQRPSYDEQNYYRPY